MIFENVYNISVMMVLPSTIAVLFTVTINYLKIDYNYKLYTFQLKKYIKKVTLDVGIEPATCKIQSNVLAHTAIIASAVTIDRNSYMLIGFVRQYY